VESGATVTFTAADMDIYEIDVEYGSSSKATTVKFSSDAVVRVQKEFRVASYAKVNPDNYNVTFYLGGGEKVNNGNGHGDEDDDDDEGDDDDDKCQDDKKNYCYQHEGMLYVSAKSVDFIGNVIALDGKIHVNGSYSRWSPTTMTGRFVAKKVYSTSKYTIWNYNECEPVDDIKIVYRVENEQEKLNVEENKLSVYPNPATNFSTVQFTAVESGNVSIEIFDITGHQVATLYKGRVEAGVPNIHEIDLTQFNSGTYIIRYITASTVLTKQLVKIK
jgi:hypothetical protein